MHRFKVGIFNQGNLVFQIGLTVVADHATMDFIVRLFDTLDLPLRPGDYVAYDYA